MNRNVLTLSETAELLRSADCFLVLTHKRPDGDTVGSAAALVRLLRALGKTAYALSNPELTPRYLPYLSPLYAPETYCPETVLAVDIAAEQMLPSNAAVYAGHIALAIDHHGSNTLTADRLYLEAKSAACGEILFALTEMLSVPLTTEIADALYAALSTDTGCFRYSNTTPRTLRIAASLMEAGCHAAWMNQQFFELHTRGRVAIESAVMNAVRFFDNGTLAAVLVSQTLVAQTCATEDDMEQLSSLPRNIEGVHVGITLYERPEGIKLSLRTDEAADASAVCKRLGGGGHIRAAGAMLLHSATHTVTLEEALTVVLDAVRAVTGAV